MPTPELSWVSNFSEFLVDAAEFSLLIPIWVGYRRRRLFQSPHRVVLWCCYMWAVLTLIAEFLRLATWHNVAVWNLVSILEGLLLGYAFYLTLHSVRTRRLLRIAAGFFLGAAATDYFYLSGLHRTTVYTTALESILLITVVLLYFEQLLQELHTVSLEREPMFLLGVGVITYFAGTVMLYLLQHSVVGAQYKIMMMINSILSIALNFVIARAFWLVGREHEPVSQPSSGR